jgi:hypothetical protein
MSLAANDCVPLLVALTASDARAAQLNLEYVGGAYRLIGIAVRGGSQPARVTRVDNDSLRVGGVDFGIGIGIPSFGMVGLKAEHLAGADPISTLPFLLSRFR